MRAQPRRGVMVCAVAVTLALAAPFAQSREERVAAATSAAHAIFEPWLGLPVTPSAPLLDAQPAWPNAPMTMDVEAQVAFAFARRYWIGDATQPLMDGAARYLQSLAVARMFDQSFGRAGSGVDALRLFGGTWTAAFPQLRFDAAFTALGRDQMSAAPARGALAFASLERIVGQPRLIGALRAVIEARPSTDRDLIRLLGEALAQDVAWLFEPALDPSRSMNYRIVRVGLDGCTPDPCHRIQVELARDGGAIFSDMEVRVDFADGQTASAGWDGSDGTRTLTFEGPSPPVRVRVDPEQRNLLDDNLLDQSKTIDGRTNAPLEKWIARWAVWLQDVMLTYSALV